MRGYLSVPERTALGALLERDAFAGAVWRTLERILENPRFERLQQRARDFLPFVVAKTLLGQADEIKEVIVAMAVFGERADFDPAESAKVRVAAADLRQRLLLYAHHEGADDELTITLPLNTYVPVIEDRCATLEVGAFSDYLQDTPQGFLSLAFTQELAFQLRSAAVRVSQGATLRLGKDRRIYTVRGSFDSMADRLHVTLSVADALQARTIFTRGFEADREDVLRLAQEAARALLDSLGEVLLPVRVRRRP